MVAELNEELAPFRILTGIEVDILEDGALDQDEDLLARLDVVVASVHSKLRMEEPEMTRRMLRAVESPHTDILGHCTGRLLVGKGRPPSTFDAEAVFEACARTGTAVEINSRPERLDPPEPLLALALAARLRGDGRHRRPRTGPARVATERLRAGGAGAGPRGPGDERPARWTSSWPGRPATVADGPDAGRVLSEYHRPVTLPVVPPVAPMLAKLARELPEREGLYYEPKWDGFRCIVFRDGDDVVLGSRNEKPLTRYFPELVESLRANLPDRCVIDGEIVIAGPGGLDFDALSQRIHPADSRVELLSRTTPASFVAFDLLALGDDDLQAEPYAVRRAALEEALGRCRPPVHLTPVTTQPDVARDWFSRFEGAGLDGVVVKDGALRYQPDKRAMMKVKHERTADCVVAGFRWHKTGDVVGSLLLGLFDDGGRPPPRRSGLGVHAWLGGRSSSAPWTPTGAAPPTATPGWPRGRPRAGSPAARAGGAPARTSAGSRSAPSWWWRWPTTTSRSTASATPPRSCAGVPTGTRTRAPTRSWTRRCPPSSVRSSAPPAEAGISGGRG